MHSTCPECSTELNDGFMGTKYCPKGCRQYCQTCGKKMAFAAGGIGEYFCQSCPTSLKELFSYMPPTPMEYPGVATCVILVSSSSVFDRDNHTAEKGDRVLVGKRKGSLGLGLYALPGGKLDYGETPYAAAIREIKEETDLDITMMAFTGIVTNDYYPSSGKHFLCMYYMASVNNPDLVKVMEPDKVEAWEWVPVNALPEMWGNTKELVESLFTSTKFVNPDIGESLF